MLARVANLVYWTARHLERAENNSRLVDVNTQLVLDLQSEAAREPAVAWAPLLFVFGDDAAYKKLYERTDELGVINYMLFDQRNPSSVISCIHQARENCRCVRDQLTLELWEQINRLYLRMQRDTLTDYQAASSVDYLGGIRDAVQLFYGIADDTLPRNEMWWFFELGRFLERADSTSRILDVKYFTLLPKAHVVGSTFDVVQWASVLRSCSALDAFRKNRSGQITLERAVEYLIFDEHFPRSIRFCLAQAERALLKISASGTAHTLNEALEQIAKLSRQLATENVGGVIRYGLHEWLDELQIAIAKIHEAVGETFVLYPSSGARTLAH